MPFALVVDVLTVGKLSVHAEKTEAAKATVITEISGAIDLGAKVHLVKLANATVDTLRINGDATLAPQAAYAQVSVGVSLGIRVAPPPLPFYAQPPIPGPGFLWTPGYWAWSDFDSDYYWVPGTWVRAPRVGFLWTPAWWGWGPGGYFFHAGYWGPHVGFYGGIAYGFGYTGFGYEGGYWNGGRWFYNRWVNNIANVNVTNVYERNVRVNHTANVSYNGGMGGVNAQPTAAQQAAMSEQHIAATSQQINHEQMARGHRQMFAAANHGNPAIGATPRPGMFQRANANVPPRPVGAAAARPANWQPRAPHPRQAQARRPHPNRQQRRERN